MEENTRVTEAGSDSAGRGGSANRPEILAVRKAAKILEANHVNYRNPGYQRG